MDARIIEQAEMMLEEDGKPAENKLTEDQATIQQKPQPSTRDINESLRRLLGSALLGEDYLPMPIGYNSNPQDNVPQKIKDAMALVRTMQSLLYSIQDSYSAYDQTDSTIKNMMAENNAKTITACLKKLNEIWAPEEKKEEKKEEKPTEEKKEESPTEEKKEEEKKEPEGDITSQIMQLIKKNETVESPRGEKFIIEEIIKDKVYVKNILTNKKFTVEAPTLLKWKNGEK
jgi:hypothetical protein